MGKTITVNVIIIVPPQTSVWTRTGVCCHSYRFMKVNFTSTSGTQIAQFVDPGFVEDD